MVDDNGITPHTHSVNLEGNEGHHLMNTISGTSLSFCLFVAKWSSLNWWNTFNWYMFGDIVTKIFKYVLWVSKDYWVCT